MNFSYFLLFFSVIFGASIGFFFQKLQKKYFNLFLTLGGAYILGISVLHLLPEVYGSHVDKIGIWVLLGFLIQLVLEKISGGIEHGHIHNHNHKKNYGIQVLIGLCVHSFLEGMPIHHLHHHHDNSYVLGIVLHKMPAAFALVGLLLHNSKQKSTIWGYIFIFALMSPLGNYIGQFFTPSGNFGTIILAVVVGSFFHIATTIIFEEDSQNHHNFPFSKALTILIGLGLSMLSL